MLAVIHHWCPDSAELGGGHVKGWEGSAALSNLVNCFPSCFLNLYELSEPKSQAPSAALQ